MSERSGHCYGQHDVHGLTDGLAVHCLLGKGMSSYNQYRFVTTFSITTQQELDANSSKRFVLQGLKLKDASNPQL